MPALVSLSPQLLSRAPQPPNGDAWLHEIKYDGYRLLARFANGRGSLFSRPGVDWTSRLPLIADAILSLRATNAYLDGELVYLNDEGMPDFERLREATRSGKAANHLYYQVFDLLNLNGRDLTRRPLVERKQRLMELLAQADHARLRYVSHIRGNGGEFFRAADQLGLEGIVSKRATSLYLPGQRSSAWIKVKCFRTQRFTVVGYTMEALDGKPALSSLALAGRSDNGEPCYAGRVEFGVPRRDDALLRVLRTLGAESLAVSGAPARSAIQWVEPQVSAEVRCLAWRPGQYVRHAVLRSVVPATT
jgi:bifunctional non-homologous end joining protein LigD